MLLEVKLKRFGVVGIIIDERQAAAQVNNVLAQFSEIIIGRMGVPHVQRDEGETNIIALIVEGTPDEVGAMAGKIGNIHGVQIKTALAAR